jgi:hypothetical protein
VNEQPWAPTKTRLRGRARRTRLVNPIMRLLLRVPFPTVLNRRLMLLAFTGQRPVGSTTNR